MNYTVGNVLPYETGLSLWFKVLEKKKKKLWVGYCLIKLHVVLIITACILIQILI